MFGSVVHSNNSS